MSPSLQAPFPDLHRSRDPRLCKSGAGQKALSLSLALQMEIITTCPHLLCHPPRGVAGMPDLGGCGSVMSDPLLPCPSHYPAP